MKLRGAISGFGEVAARAHLPGWRTREQILLQVVHEPVAARRHEAINLIAGVRVYDDLELMLDGEAPDLVDIASPPAFHAETARLALAAGAHVLVEKPLCFTLEEFDALTRLAVERGRVLMCVHNWRFAPAYVAARRAIESDAIGAVRRISIDRLRTEPAGAGGSGASWRRSAKSGGGILIDHGWHVFYLMQWLLGGERPASVSAQLAESGDADDLANLQVTFRGGVEARSQLSWRAPSRRTTASIEGERGTLEIDGGRVRLIRPAGAADLVVQPDPDDSYHATWFAAVAEEFEQAIAQGPAGPIAVTNLAEARSSLALIIAARQSAAAGGARVGLGDFSLGG